VILSPKLDEFSIALKNHFLYFLVNQFNPMPPSDAVWKQKYILEDLFSSVLSHFKKYHPSGNLNFNNSSIFQNLKLRISVGKSF